jgi:hypothetical protein
MAMARKQTPVPNLMIILVLAVVVVCLIVLLFR